MQKTGDSPGGRSEIAIVGMAAHLPGSSAIADFRTSFRDGIRAIRTLDEDALLAAGERPGDPAAACIDAAIEAAFRHAVEHNVLTATDDPVTLFRPPLDRRWKVGGNHCASTAREYGLDDNDSRDGSFEWLLQAARAYGWTVRGLRALPHRRPAKRPHESSQA